MQAFVLGGGGARGALQVGALRALLEYDFKPDLLVGTSIGALNAAAVALWGFDAAGLARMEHAWKEVANAQILDPRFAQLIIKAMVGRPSDHSRQQSLKFMKRMGVDAEMTFGDITGIRLAVVSADIETGQPVIYGDDASDNLMEGLLASINVPPWFQPVHRGEKIIIDGGLVSNLPIEPALRLGAENIIALDLEQPVRKKPENLSLPDFFQKAFYAVNQRYTYLESALAEAHGVPVKVINFEGLCPYPIWDFSHHRELIGAGYEQAVGKLETWKR